MRNLNTRWTLPVGTAVVALLIFLLGWSLFAKGRRLEADAAGADTGLVGSDATDACAVGISPPAAQAQSLGDGTNRHHALPALDVSQPAAFETATFAMG